MNILFYAVSFIFITFYGAGAMEVENDREICTRSNSEGIRLEINNNNFSLLLPDLNKPLMKEGFSKILSLWFVCDVSETAIRDLNILSDEIWNDKYLFTNKKEKEINDTIKRSVNLRELVFYNIPSLVSLIANLSNAASITHLHYNYDTRVFDASICLKHLEGCHQFVNLQWLSLHTGVFTFAEEKEIVDFFSPFTKLRTLELTELMCDQIDGDRYSTDLIQSLTVLKLLDKLTVSFVDKPDLLPLTSLSPLNIQTLSIACHIDKVSEQNVPCLNIVGLLRIFRCLENLTINNTWISNNRDMTGDDSISTYNASLKKVHTQLKSLNGNYVWFYEEPVPAFEAMFDKYA